MVVVVGYPRWGAAALVAYYRPCSAWHIAWSWRGVTAASLLLQYLNVGICPPSTTYFQSVGFFA